MKPTILFLCPHNAAKSVIAAAYFNQQVERLGLSFAADSAGTEPSESVNPVVVEMLKRDELDVSEHQPRRVSAEALQTAYRIVSMGCSAEELAVDPERIESWGDVPAVSSQPDVARETIRTHVDQLINELRIIQA